MLCSTLHDFCEIACSSCRASFPAPMIFRSMTNLGIALSLGLVWGMRDAGPAARLRRAKPLVLRQMPRRAGGAAPRVRDKCPVSIPDEAFGPPETGLAGQHDGLIAVLDTNLVEHPRDVVAHRLLREPERGGDLGIVEALGDAFEHRALARSQLIERQHRLAALRAHAARFVEKALQLREQPWPRRLVGERHVVVAVELDEAGVGNEAREQPALLDRH